jgi:hypothetical protein
VSVSGSQLCFKVTRINVACEPRIAQYQAHGPYLIKYKLRLIHDERATLKNA